MALQNSDYFLVNRAGTSYKVEWNELQAAQEGSLRIEDVWDYTIDGGGTTTRANSQVPLDIDQGIRLPVAGTGDYNQDGAIRYSPANSKIELYYSGAWNTASGGTAFSPTPPVPATEGDVWYDTDNGRAYVYYNDGTSSQWVEMNPAWDGGVPPSVVTGELITDGTIEPVKLSADAINWDAQGYHAIGQAVDQTARLTVRSPNSNSAQTGLRLTQGNTTNTRTQYLELYQDESKATSSIKADNTGTDAELEIQVGSSTKMTFSENGNITTGAPLESGSGFIGNVTGDLTGTASQLNRQGTNSTDTNFYRVLFGGTSDTAGSVSAKVVTNRSSLTYRPSDNRLTCGLVAADLIGTADNSNELGGLAPSSYFRLASNNTVTGTSTFNGNITFKGSNFHTANSRYNDNVRANFGNSSDVEFFFNGSNMYTDLNAGNYYIRDNTTTRFTFVRSSGAFTATGNITAPTFVGNLNGNATSSTTATTATNANNVKVDASTSSNQSLLLGSDTGTGNKRSRRSTNLYWAGSTNTLHTNNLNLTGFAEGGTYVDINVEGTITEEVHTITWSSGFTINPGKGSFQLVTLSGNSTPTQSGWSSGQSVTLMIASTSTYTVNWGTLNVKWVGGTAPLIPTTGYGVYQLWKIGSSIYGAIVGDVD